MFSTLARIVALVSLFWFGGLVSGRAALPGRERLPDRMPAIVGKLTPLGQVPATNLLHLTIGLPLRHQPELDDLIRQLYDPANPNYQKYLTPQEFTARFGPSPEDYNALLDFARTNGFQIVGTHRNRMLVDVVGTAATAERMFGVTLRTYRHPREARNFYAPDTQPSVQAPMALLNVSGLDNYSRPHPNFRPRPALAQSAAAPRSGSGSGGTYMGNDFRAAYVPGTALTGAGQSVGLVQFDGYYSNDIASYISQAGISTGVVLTNVPINGGVATPGSGAEEVSLDIEMAISMAPGLDKIYVYEAPNGSTAWSTILSRMANDNLAKQLSCSWGGGSPDATSEQIFKQMAAQGQSFFNASGDSDAFTGAVPFPSDSTNITQVGGTTLSTTSAGGSYASETVWNWGGGTGSSGGVSTYYAIPYWQTNISMASNGGSTTYRNIPDVALAGDNVYVIYGNGSSQSVGGTSCAAPLWAGYTALINQQAAQAAKPPVGFLNPALYAMAGNAAYNNNFHDITTGDNTSSSSPTNYYAQTGYDLCTGLGTPNGTNLINALAPLVFAPAIAGGNCTLLAESAVPANGAIDPGETVTVSFGLQNTGNLATSNLVATLQPSANVLAPSGPQNYGVLAAFGGTNSQSFTFTAAGTCGSNLTAIMLLQDGTNDLGSVAFALPLGKASGLTQNFDDVAVPALPAGWTSVNVFNNANLWNTTTAGYDTAPNSAFISDSADPGENALVTPPINIISTSAQLSFRQNYSLEYVAYGGGGTAKTYYYYDGGVLEIRIGNGAFTDILAAGGSFVTNGYNNTITTTSDNALGGRSAWVGNTKTWKQVIVRLPAAAAGQAVQLRWNCSTDTGNGGNYAVGWYVDSISLTDVPPSCLAVFTDIAASQTLATNSLMPGQNLVYTLSVTNLGPQVAANVILTDTVPVNASFISAAPGCNYSAGQLVCPVGTLAASAGTNFTVTLAPDAAGSMFTNLISVGTVTPEVSTANNTATLVATQSTPTPPGITSGPNSQLIECGGSASFSIVVTGSPPLSIQWNLDGIPVSGATNSSLLLDNVHLPDHLVSVVVTNPYGSATNSAALAVQDTQAPVIALNGNNPMTVELGGTFTDPGAIAVDTCAGVVPVTISGTVNVNVAATNRLIYTADDGNGHTNSAMRSVIVRDTTPPTIEWSFTNLVLAADTNCGAAMPDVTGTNYIFATDLSGPPAISQIPTNGADLSVGTNVVVIAVSDLYSNIAYSTNVILVQDQNPPQILLPPQSQTNVVGGTAAFTTAASACTPVAYQWFHGTNALAAQTDSTLTLSNLTLSLAGDYFVVASAAGGSSTSAIATLTVNLNPATVTLTSPENPAGFLSALVFTAGILPANATGTVQFFTNGAPFDVEPVMAGQAASTNLASLPRGTNFVTAVYSGDASYQPATNLLEQVVTNHPPVAVAAFYTNGSNFALNIMITDLATNWSDMDGDALMLADVSVSTNGITLTDTGKLLIYSNTNNVADQFICTITDGHAGTNFQTVFILPAPSVNTTPFINSVASSSDGGVTLNLAGASGYTYILEATTNLLDSGSWQPLVTNTLGTSGLWQFSDPDATNFVQRFYRLQLAP